jgi:putative hydrolase of the HAD superfamily
MGPIAAVLFDLDDTLMDTESAWRAGVAHLVARRTGGSVPLQSAATAWDEVFPHWFDRYLRGRVSLPDSRIGRVREWAARLEVAVPEGEELAWFDTYVDGYRSSWALFPDAAPALAALSVLPLGLVTNGDSAMQREKVTSLALDQMLDVVLVSSEVGLPKPEPEIFLRAAAHLGVPPARCLMVGDRLDRDISGALAAGMQAAWLRRPGGPEAGRVPPADLAGRFLTIDSLRALPSIAGVDGGAGRDAGGR